MVRGVTSAILAPACTARLSRFHGLARTRSAAASAAASTAARSAAARAASASASAAAAARAACGVSMSFRTTGSSLSLRWCITHAAWASGRSEGELEARPR